MNGSHAGFSGQHARVSITGPPAFLASPNWTKVHSAVTAQLPLRNIHWKSPGRGSLRTIQELDVALVPFDTLRDEHSQVPTTVLEKPLLHVYIIHCEDSDLETYRTSLKKQIKDWHLAVTSRKHQEWLILHIIRPDTARPNTNNFFQMKGTVLDKLRTDFNLDKRDRCVQINWMTGNENPQAWAEFINKVKEGIVNAFDSAVTQRQEEVTRSESQQLMPGWNFCTFFILKESLASSYEGMGLYEEALIPYKELEDAFFRVSSEKSMSWFGTLIAHHSQDDAASLLNTKKKPYKDLILANNISVFDFSIYLLGRRCQLMARLGKITEITSQVGFFIGSFAHRLREVEAMLPPLFIEAWSYCSALSTVEQVDNWCRTYSIELSKSIYAGKAELLDIARTQLDRIGAQTGHLPRSSPFTNTLPSNSPAINPGTLRFNDPPLNSAVQNQDAFHKLYVALINNAIDLYAKSGRRKFALKLYACLAALEIHRGNLLEALNTYTSLPGHYAPHMWTCLESFMLSRALEVHSSLGKSQDGEWIHIVLSFLKTYVEQHVDGSEAKEEDIPGVLRLVQSLREASAALDNDLAHPDHPALTISVHSEAKLPDTKDGALIEVTVENHLPCPFPSEEITIVLSGRDGDKFDYSTIVSESLPPGKTTFSLFCPCTPSGTFLLESSEIRSSKLLFQSNYRKNASKSQQSKLPTLVRVPKDVMALDARIQQSNHIELGKTPSVMITIYTGRNSIDTMFVRLSSPSVGFKPQEAKVLDEESCETFDIVEDKIRIVNVDMDESVTFVVPHTDASSTALKFNVEVEYKTDNEQALSRTARFSKTLLSTLPVSVNVEDFFRGTRLISRFTVSTTSHQHVQVADARLEAPGNPEGVTVAPCLKSRAVVTVTPAQPANFLFSVDSLNGPVRDPLSLSIKYRMLREEVESVVEEQVRSILDEEDPLSPKRRILIVEKIVKALESSASWIGLYGATGHLNVPPVQTEEADIKQLLEKVLLLLSKHQHSTSPQGKWRLIKIPVDVPFMNIVASASICISNAGENGSTKPALYAGQPISASISIQTTFHWGSTATNSKPQYVLRYNVDEMIREWLVSGPKRGDFVASDGGTHTVPITLIALHHGEFSLPKISVTAHAVAGVMTMGSMAVPTIETYQAHGAEKALVLPRGGRNTFVVNMGANSG